MPLNSMKILTGIITDNRIITDNYIQRMQILKRFSTVQDNGGKDDCSLKGAGMQYEGWQMGPASHRPLVLIC